MVLDKENAHARRGIYMIDASRGFTKDGNKNRLRRQDRGRFQARDRRTTLLAHGRLRGDRSQRLQPEYPALHRLQRPRRSSRPCALFEDGERSEYEETRVPAQEVSATVLQHPEFDAFEERVLSVFEGWRAAHDGALRGLNRGSDPKSLIGDISEDHLARFGSEELVSRYEVYQHLMDYWAEEMQYDVYAIAQDGWEVGRVIRPAYEGLMDKFLPQWRSYRDELNQAPLAHEEWAS